MFLLKHKFIADINTTFTSEDEYILRPQTAICLRSLGEPPTCEHNNPQGW